MRSCSPLSTATARDLFQPFHCAPDRNVPPEGAIVGKPAIVLADEPTGNLDSKNGEVVMNLIRQLNRDGATICMVTHDPRYAKHADRTIHLFDGQIVEETRESGFDLDRSSFGAPVSA